MLALIIISSILVYVLAGSLVAKKVCSNELIKLWKKNEAEKTKAFYYKDNFYFNLHKDEAYGKALLYGFFWPFYLVGSTFSLSWRKGFDDYLKRIEEAEEAEKFWLERRNVGSTKLERDMSEEMYQTAVNTTKRVKANG